MIIRCVSILDTVPIFVVLSTLRSESEILTLFRVHRELPSLTRKKENEQMTKRASA